MEPRSPDLFDSNTCEWLGPSCVFVDGSGEWVFFVGDWAATLCMASPRSRSNLRHDELSQAAGEKSRPNYNMFDRVKTLHGKVCSGNIVSLSEQQFVDDSGCTGGLVGHAFSFARTIAA